MRKTLFLVLVVIVWIFVFPSKAKAEQNVYIRYFSYNEEGEEIWKYKEVSLEDSYEIEDFSRATFEELFKDGAKGNYVPEGTKLLTIVINDNHLILNVSEDIRNYGGSFYELCLKNQIINTALDIPGIKKVTLLIDNASTYLPEGSYIKEETE